MIRNNNFKYYVEKENFLNESEVNYIKENPSINGNTIKINSRQKKIL